jgi:hypothetical protein
VLGRSLRDTQQYKRDVTYAGPRPARRRHLWKKRHQWRNVIAFVQRADSAVLAISSTRDRANARCRCIPC